MVTPIKPGTARRLGLRRPVQECQHANTVDITSVASSMLEQMCNDCGALVITERVYTP